MLPNLHQFWKQEINKSFLKVLITYTLSRIQINIYKGLHVLTQTAFTKGLIIADKVLQANKREQMPHNLQYVTQLQTQSIKTL